MLSLLASWGPWMRMQPFDLQKAFSYNWVFSLLSHLQVACFVNLQQCFQESILCSSPNRKHKGYVYLWDFSVAARTILKCYVLCHATEIQVIFAFIAFTKIVWRDWEWEDSFRHSCCCGGERRTDGWTWPCPLWAHAVSGYCGWGKLTKF